jgi:hypothetical protein
VQLGVWKNRCNNPCTGYGNWAASVNPKGATPSKANSVRKYNPDKSELKLLRAYPIDNRNLILVFNKTLDSLRTNNYQTIGLTIKIGKFQVIVL